MSDLNFEYIEKSFRDCANRSAKVEKLFTGGIRFPDNPRHIRLFTVNVDGSLSGGEIFAECTRGSFDGFRVDEQGRIWTSAEDGVHCYEPDGTLIGKILVPEEVSNLVFGGQRHNRMFITASSSLVCGLTVRQRCGHVLGESHQY